jgi:hypothetical protein
VKPGLWCAAGVTLLAALPAVLLAAPAHAESSFTALASATAVDTTVANDDFPLVPVLEAAGPSAGTSWDSTGQGTAFASDPYPGTTVAELPATAAGLTGLPVPAYPLFVATTSDDAPADDVRPGAELHATCDGSAPGCRATSLAGSVPATTQARSSIVQPSGDEVTATAFADTADFSIPGGVTLSGTHTSATVSLRDGKLSRRSELTVSRLTVGGTQAFSIRNGKVFVAGSEVPVPFATLDQALHAAGVDAELIAAAASPSGVVAPVLRLRTVLPAGPAVVTHPTAVVYTVGGADASVTLGTFRVAATGGVLHQPAPARAGAAPSAATAAPALGGATAPEPLPDVAAGAPGLPPADPPALAASDGAPTQQFDVADIYLALVLCGVVWFGATQAQRIVGVRFRWTS